MGIKGSTLESLWGLDETTIAFGSPQHTIRAQIMILSYSNAPQMIPTTPLKARPGALKAWEAKYVHVHKVPSCPFLPADSPAHSCGLSLQVWASWLHLQSHQPARHILWGPRGDLASALHPKYSSTKTSEAKISLSTRTIHPGGPEGASPAIQRIHNYLAAQKHSLKQERGHHLQEVPLDCPLLFLTLLPLRCLGTAALTTLAGAECSVGTREGWLCRGHERGSPSIPHSDHHSHSTKHPEGWFPREEDKVGSWRTCAQTWKTLL